MLGERRKGKVRHPAEWTGGVITTIWTALCLVALAVVPVSADVLLVGALVGKVKTFDASTGALCTTPFGDLEGSNVTSPFDIAISPSSGNIIIGGKTPSISAAT